MDTQASRSLPSFLRAHWSAVNVFGSHQGGLSTRFAAAVPGRFADIAYTPGLGGCPVLLTARRISSAASLIAWSPASTRSF